MFFSKRASAWLAVGLTCLAVPAWSATENPCAKALGGAPRFRPQLETLGERINPVLYAPSGLDASLVTNTSAMVSWYDNSYEDGYDSRNEDSFVVERWDASSGWGTVAVTGPNTTSFLDQSLDYDTTYYYRVYAFESSEGYSYASNEDSVTTLEAAPATPTFLRATSVTSSAVTLTWQDRSSNEDGFEIYRARPNGTYEYFDYVFANTTTYTDIYVNPGETYFYYVAAYNDGGYSGGSNEVQVDVPETVPNGPSSLTASAANARQVQLQWRDNSQAEQGFVIERSINGGAYTVLTSVAANVQSFVDTSAQPDTRYGYRVTAFNGFGSSAFVEGSVRTPIESFTDLNRAKDIYAVSVPSPQGGILRVYDRADGRLVFSEYAFPGFGGEVRIATGDVTGDGVVDVVAAAGPGGGSHVKVFSGVDGQLAYSFFAFDGWFGGLNVAVGDIDNDGRADIVVAADAGGGPHVKAFSGRTGGELMSFFAYGATFSGGVRVAAGDTDGDGYADIVTAAGPGGGPHVKVFSGKTGAELQSFMAYDPNITSGVYVAAGDLDGDGKADIVTGVGGVAPHVRAFRGSNPDESLMSFYAYDVKFAGGVRVAVSAGADGRTPIVVTGPGKGGGPHIRGFKALSGEPDPTVNFFADDAFFTGGVYVGGVP